MRLNRLPEAGEEFHKAATIDPRHPGALQSLAHVLRKLGKPAEGVEYAKRAAKLTNYENADMLLTLADVCLDAGLMAEAEESATRALSAAQKSDARLIPSVRRRLEEIKLRRP